MVSSVDPYGMKTRAVAFAVRAGHTDEMAHKFLERVCADGLLNQPRQFGPLLAEMMRRPAEESVSERCTCGDTECESELCDCDARPCPVDHAAEERRSARETLVTTLTNLLARTRNGRMDEHRTEAERLVDDVLHEAAEAQRALPVYADGRATWHRHVLYGYAGESFKAQEELDGLTESIVRVLADHIDPEVTHA